MKYKASIVIPSIRPENWPSLIKNLTESAGKHSIQIIFVGPELTERIAYAPEPGPVRVVADYGSPSRCLQIGSTLAEGKFLHYVSDDFVALGNAIERSIDIAEQPNTIPILKYVEGGINLGFQNQAQHFHDGYWTAGYHPDLRQTHVKPEWIWGLPMIKLKLWEYMGGIDCRFEHINMNLHDLMFRIQAKHLAEVVLPPFFSYTTTWAPKAPDDPVGQAFTDHDNILFKQLYADGGCGVDHEVKLDNWKQQPAIWERRFKKN